MFRLIKLAFYALVGYVLYELYQGMTQEQHADRTTGGGSRSFGDASRGALTGGGRGAIDTASDADGGEMRHTVGRGVVSR